MKQGTGISKAVIIALFCAIVVYIGVYAWRAVTDPFQTVLTYRYTMDDSAEAVGFFVRQEMVIPGQGLTMDVLPAEGEKVGAGQAVAVLYRDSAALDRKQAMNALELELSQLNYALRRRDSVGDAAQLDSDIVSAMATLSSSVSVGGLSDVESQTLALRSMVLKRVDTYESNAESVAAIETMIADVSTELRTLNAAAAQDSTRVTVSVPGVFSGLADGYEALLTPEGLSDLTVARLEELTAMKVTADESAVGKLITDSRWYFAASLQSKAADRLLVGNQVRVRFSGDFHEEVSMRVERIGWEEDGKCCVIFSSTRFLADTTLLRGQTADVIFEQYTGIRVPKRAMRVLEDGTPGVYVVVGMKAEFKPVTIMREGEDFYLVESASDGKRTLRAGDEVIVAAVDLYDGKVVR